MKTTIKFISAEQILPLRSAHYSKIIDDVRKTAEWKATVKREQAGAEQIIKGTYWKKLPPNFVKPEDLKNIF